MAPLMDVRVSEPLASSLTNQTPGYSFHGRQTSATLARPLDAWRDKLKDRGAIIATHHAERMRSVVISSQELVKLSACRHRRSTSHR
ncbi:BZ3500_MvSof-1268-A1-R1_Chr9g10371 [Microbotryum saponariae]|uniref:BZ3500_MvSof-1268-A1-R1_Chr9g10371 protein n=1 Tax=Microbotryum saponariae TaxID=289078 RepID=A0A2X0L0D1_9BASI|nr:BZ3501_MvSof-1269-A2-R1_Chr9g10121 [Microbotryum saponariae]SCZ99981.1 BZ3500_MvSof-1268-A1-R1_Chr9g10371 [Microbotryum saponariae]